MINQNAMVNMLTIKIIDQEIKMRVSVMKIINNLEFQMNNKNYIYKY